ncbi:MAG: hypothetical protein ACOCQD_01415 [archaeon]
MNDTRFNVNQMEGKLSHDINPESLNSISGYAAAIEEVNTYCESVGVPLSSGFGGYIQDEGRSKSLKQKFMSPLYAESNNISNSRREGFNGGLSDDDILIGERADMINDDMRMVQDKIDATWELYQEAFTTGESIAPMMAAIPPVQYLETIKSNGRLVVDHKSTDQYTFRKKWERRYLEVDGERRYFPDVVKDKEFMDQFLNHSQPEFTAEIVAEDFEDNKANLITLSGITNVNKDKNSLFPEVKITDVVATVDVDGTPTDRPGIFKETNDNIITQHEGAKNNPQFFVITEVDNSADEDGSSTVEVAIGGRIDFTTGNISWRTQDNVKSFKVEGRVSGSTISKVSSVGVERDPMDFTIKERLNMVLSYYPKTLKDFGTIENTDGMMKLTATILDLAGHVKDHKIFKTLSDYKEALSLAERLPVGHGTPNDWFEKDFEVDPTTSEAYRPTTPINWREDMLPDTIDDMIIELQKKFNAKNGIKNVIYADPRTTKLLPKMVSIVSKDKEYAGVAVDYDVFSINIKGNQIRVVSSERSGGFDELTIVPRSNDKEQETFTFYQGYSKLFKNGEIRDINHLQLPSIAYLDTFDMFPVHAIMARVNII